MLQRLNASMPTVKLSKSREQHAVLLCPKLMMTHLGKCEKYGVMCTG